MIPKFSHTTASLALLLSITNVPWTFAQILPNELAQVPPLDVAPPMPENSLLPSQTFNPSIIPNDFSSTPLPSSLFFPPSQITASPSPPSLSSSIPTFPNTLNSSATLTAGSPRQTGNNTPKPAIYPNGTRSDNRYSNSTSPSSRRPNLDILPLKPVITPAIAVAGILLIGMGLTYALIGIKNEWLNIFLSTAFLMSLGVAVLIIYVMNPPVSNAIQGAYLVAITVSGFLLGALALIFSEITSSLACILAGFCLSMWLLTLTQDGLISSSAGRVILIAALSVAMVTVWISRYTRTYALIASTSFAGATIAMLGIDCFSRVGLKEFWLYLWNLNPSVFPIGTKHYPVTRGIRVESAGIILITIFGLVSQSKLWHLIKTRRAQKTADHRRKEENLRQLEAEIGKRIESDVSRERAEWEATYGNGVTASPTADSETLTGRKRSQYLSGNFTDKRHSVNLAKLQPNDDPRTTYIDHHHAGGYNPIERPCDFISHGDLFSHTTASPPPTHNSDGSETYAKEHALFNSHQKSVDSAMQTPTRKLPQGNYSNLYDPEANTLVSGKSVKSNKSRVSLSLFSKNRSDSGSDDTGSPSSVSIPLTTMPSRCVNDGYAGSLDESGASEKLSNVSRRWSGRRHPFQGVLGNSKGGSRTSSRAHQNSDSTTDLSGGNTDRYQATSSPTDTANDIDTDDASLLDEENQNLVTAKSALDADQCNGDQTDPGCLTTPSLPAGKSERAGVLTVSDRFYNTGSIGNLNERYRVSGYADPGEPAVMINPTVGLKQGRAPGNSDRILPNGVGHHFNGVSGGGRKGETPDSMTGRLSFTAQSRPSVDDLQAKQRRSVDIYSVDGRSMPNRMPMASYTVGQAVAAPGIMGGRRDRDVRLSTSHSSSRLSSYGELSRPRSYASNLNGLMNMDGVASGVGYNSGRNSANLHRQSSAIMLSSKYNGRGSILHSGMPGTGAGYNHHLLLNVNGSGIGNGRASFSMPNKPDFLIPESMSLLEQQDQQMLERQRQIQNQNSQKDSINGGGLINSVTGGTPNGGGDPMNRYGSPSMMRRSRTSFLQAQNGSGMNVPRYGYGAPKNFNPVVNGGGGIGGVGYDYRTSMIRSGEMNSKQVSGNGTVGGTLLNFDNGPASHIDRRKRGSTAAMGNKRVTSASGGPSIDMLGAHNEAIRRLQAGVGSE